MPSELPPPEDLPVIADPATIAAAPRAVVYCCVEWSGPERMARRVIRDAIARLRTAEGPIAFEFFAIEEDAPAFAEWLASHQWPVMGSGGVLWVEAGRCVAREIAAGQAGVEGIVRGTEALWGETAPLPL
ncbi:MAG TPA: hypothetical protein VK986_15480 [Tepidisphaeraceae bacterium]|nr:hypothetical protein [Tepidisphaeraceae bacterium]